MSFSFDAVVSEAEHLASTIEEHPHAALWTAAGVSAGVVAVVATRGRALAAPSTLPELEIAGTKALEAISPETNAALREPTIAEQATAGMARASFKNGKRILRAIGRDWAKPEPITASDEVRRTVFNRFLSTLDQNRWLVHGSYPLESRSYVVRKALTDLDLLSLDKGLLKPTRAETDEALLQDLKRMVSKPGTDGITFEVPPLNQLPPHVQLMQPRLRTGAVIAKVDGKELMRIPYDVRLGAETILEPIDVALKNPAGGADTATVVRSMQPEENFASKLYSYTNRTFGFTRKPKDLSDMAAMIRRGLDDNKVEQAMEAWTTRGYTLGPMRHPADVLGRYLERNMAGQTTEQLDANFGVVRNYYARLAPRIQAEPLRDGVNMSPLAQLGRFLHKQYIVYPVG